MNFRLLLVVVACLLVGAAIYLAPRLNESALQEPTASQSSNHDDSFDHQLEEVKQKMDATVLANIEFFEGRLEQANANSKVVWLDSLTSVWDRQMRPGIAAEYVLRKAEATNSAEDWKMAGVRFLGISRFFQGDDKVVLSDRATECLIKANALAPNDIDIKTQLGSSYVESGKEPMKGIFLLREVVAQDSTNVDAQLNLGFFSMQSGQYDKAVSRFKTVMRLKPEMLEVRLYLSEALQAVGDSKGALQELNYVKKNTSDSELISEADLRIRQIESNTTH
jgi:cytochrome c-type biogenesis protein CcmH/NrfG